MSGVAGSDITGDMSLTLAKLRRENALSDVVHDPEEDAPHVVGIPRQYALSTSGRPPSNWRHRHGPDSGDACSIGPGRSDPI